MTHILLLGFVVSYIKVVEVVVEVVHRGDVRLEGEQAVVSILLLLLAGAYFAFLLRLPQRSIHTSPYVVDVHRAISLCDANTYKVTCAGR